jgi:hypothetical protein
MFLWMRSYGRLSGIMRTVPRNYFEQREFLNRPDCRIIRRVRTLRLDQTVRRANLIHLSQSNQTVCPIEDRIA